jgi:hypothetical protein
MKLSDGEKLIILMLADMYKHLKIKGEFDPAFIQHTILYDHLWGLDWKYSGIPFEKEQTPHQVTEVVNALDMWWFIEQSYAQLSKADKDRVKKDADPFGTHVKFEGFDGNNLFSRAARSLHWFQGQRHELPHAFR